MIRHNKTFFFTFPLFFLLASTSCGGNKILIAQGNDIDKIGGLKFVTTLKEIKDANIEYGDIVTVKVNNKTYDLPFVSNYIFIPSGQYYIMDNETYGRAISAYYSNFTKKEGITKDMLPLEVTFQLKQKGGYRKELNIRNIERSNDRLDYTGSTTPFLKLNDEDYANFREVCNVRIKRNLLYRSSSPINDSLNRNAEADRASRNHNIRTIINLTDFKEIAETLPGYQGSYYQDVAEGRLLLEDTSVFYNPLDVYVEDDSFANKLIDVFNYMLLHQGPYLFHCDEGQDRTGLIIALLQGLMEVSYDDIIFEYMKTFANYYGVRINTEKYAAFAGNLETNLNNLLHKKTDATNLKTNIIEFLRNHNFGNDKIQSLITILLP